MKLVWISMISGALCGGGGCYYGQLSAEHRIAKHWYDRCVKDAPYEDKKYEYEIPPWCGVRGKEMELDLGIEDRWPEEMP